MKTWIRIQIRKFFTPWILIRIRKFVKPWIRIRMKWMGRRRGERRAGMGMRGRRAGKGYEVKDGWVGG